MFEPSSVPSVWDVDAGVGYAVSLDLAAVDDPWACAHVAIAPDAGHLACTVQETYADLLHMAPEDACGPPYTVEVDTDHDGTPDEWVRPYFTIEFAPGDDGVWTSTTGAEMFPHAGPADLEAIDPRFDQAACGSPTHSIDLHTYVRYCGDTDHVVVMVWCQGPTELGDSDELPAKVVYSAAFLIDLNDRAAPRYLDLNQALRDQLGDGVAPDGVLHSASVSCGAVREGGQAPTERSSETGDRPVPARRHRHIGAQRPYTFVRSVASEAEPRLEGKSLTISDRCVISRRV